MIGGILYTVKMSPPFYFPPPWPEGKFKAGLIELCVGDYLRKFESGQIQD